MRRDKTKLYPYSGYGHRGHRSKRKSQIFASTAQTKGRRRQLEEKKDRLRDREDREI